MKSDLFFFSTLNNYILSAVLKLKWVSVALYNLKHLEGMLLALEKEHMVNSLLAFLCLKML